MGLIHFTEFNAIIVNDLVHLRRLELTFVRIHYHIEIFEMFVLAVLVRVFDFFAVIFAFVLKQSTSRRVLLVTPHTLMRSSRYAANICRK